LPDSQSDLSCFSRTGIQGPRSSLFSELVRQALRTLKKNGRLNTSDETLRVHSPPSEHLGEAQGVARRMAIARPCNVLMCMPEGICGNAIRLPTAFFLYENPRPPPCPVSRCAKRSNLTLFVAVTQLQPVSSSCWLPFPNSPTRPALLHIDRTQTSTLLDLKLLDLSRHFLLLSSHSTTEASENVEAPKQVSPHHTFHAWPAVSRNSCTCRSDEVQP
jgi:hypothetical protein